MGEEVRGARARAAAELVHAKGLVRVGVAVRAEDVGSHRAGVVGLEDLDGGEPLGGESGVARVERARVVLLAEEGGKVDGVADATDGGVGLREVSRGAVGERAMEKIAEEETRGGGRDGPEENARRGGGARERRRRASRGERRASRRTHGWPRPAARRGVRAEGTASTS